MKPTTMDRELQLKIMHAEARQKLINDLMEWTALSQDGGEYYISFNGCRMWLSYKEAQNYLIAMRATINVWLDLLRRQAADNKTAKIPWEEYEDPIPYRSSET